VRVRRPRECLTSAVMVTQHLVVDGSNIATEGRSTPSLAQLESAVEELRKEFPDAEVTVVVDATFAHRIDPSELDRFEQAALRGEYVYPPAGAIGRGDAFLLRIAERVDGVALSNDSFQEFHGEHGWLFDRGRLLGATPVPGVGWIFVPRTPVRGPRSRVAVRDASRAKERVVKAIAQATKEVVEPEPDGAAGERARRPRGRGHAQQSPQAVNDPMTFISFIADHPLGDEIEGEVESFTSHGAVVRFGDVRCYVPLSGLGSPAPRAAREILHRSEVRTFVVTALDPFRRGVELALPGIAVVSGRPSEETVAAEVRMSRSPARKAAPAESATRKQAGRTKAAKSIAPSPPAKAQPAKAQPAKAVPTKAVPTKAVPTKAVPTKAQPTKAQPTKALPTKAQPTSVKAERATSPVARRSSSGTPRPIGGPAKLPQARSGTKQPTAPRTAGVQAPARSAVAGVATGTGASTAGARRPEAAGKLVARTSSATTTAVGKPARSTTASRPASASRDAATATAPRAATAKATAPRAATAKAATAKAATPNAATPNAATAKAATAKAATAKAVSPKTAAPRVVSRATSTATRPRSRVAPPPAPPRAEPRRATRRRITAGEHVAAPEAAATSGRARLRAPGVPGGESAGGTATSRAARPVDATATAVPRATAARAAQVRPTEPSEPPAPRRSPARTAAMAAPGPARGRSGARDTGGAPAASGSRRRTAR